jgi:hypothetical protein
VLQPEQYHMPVLEARYRKRLARRDRKGEKQEPTTALSSITS